MLDALIANSINHTRAWLYYEPKHYDGKVVYFRANEKRQGTEYRSRVKCMIMY